MDKFLEDIIDKYKEFNKFLNELEVNSFKKYSRKELKEFSKLLRDNESKRYLDLDISKLIEEKKKEEFPQILGVHNYPVINEIDFLNDEQKVKLDDFLLRCGQRSYFGAINREWFDFIEQFDNEDEIAEKILKFLLDKNMISISYEIELCCEDRALLTYEQLEKIIKYKELIEKEDKDNTDYTEIEELYMSMPHNIFFNEDGTQYCPECNEDIDMDLKDYKELLNNKLNYCYCRLIVERDTTYDNI